MNRSEFLADLRKKMEQRFNKTELRVLCMELGIDDENLNQNTKSDFIQDLILKMNRTNQLHTLTDKCRTLNPHKNWLYPNNFEEEEDNMVHLASSPSSEDQEQSVSVNTGGGAYIGGNVNLGGGNFVGRDQQTSTSKSKLLSTSGGQYTPSARGLIIGTILLILIGLIFWMWLPIS